MSVCLCLGSLASVFGVRGLSPPGQRGLGSGPCLPVPALEDMATAEGACGSPTVALQGRRLRRGTGGRLRVLSRRVTFSTARPRTGVLA